MEVREEEEMSAIERHRLELQDKRNSEKYTEKQRLEEERAAYKKKEELLQQARERHAREKQLQNVKHMRWNRIGYWLYIIIMRVLRVMTNSIPEMMHVC